jgi:hypothetical protein
VSPLQLQYESVEVPQANKSLQKHSPQGPETHETRKDPVEEETSGIKYYYPYGKRKRPDVDCIPG